MINNEQENYTGEHQEEGWFAKNKAAVIGICLLLAVAGFWAFSSRNNEPAAPAAAESTKVKTYFDKAWKYLDKKPSLKELGIITAGVVSLGLLNKHYGWSKRGVNKFKQWRKSKGNKNPNEATNTEIEKLG